MKKHRNLVMEGRNGKPIVYDVFYNQEKKKLPIVIFAHGFKGFKDWGPFNLVGEEFAKNGFFFVKFNFSYNGGLPNDPIDFPDLDAFGQNNYSKEQDDFDVLINALFKGELPYEEYYNRDKIYLVGHSRGGAGAILYTAFSNCVSKVVTWAAPSNLEKRFDAYDLKEWKDKGVIYIDNSRTLQKMPLYYQFYEDFIRNRSRLDIEQAVRKIKVPFLAIHGKRDETVPIENVRDFKAWNNFIQTLELMGAGHTFDGKHPLTENVMPGFLKEIMTETIAFLNRT